MFVVVFDFKFRSHSDTLDKPVLAIAVIVKLRTAAALAKTIHCAVRSTASLAATGKTATANDCGKFEAKNDTRCEKKINDGIGKLIYLQMAI